jgi:threonine-phosphate decarboxylase
MARRHGGDVQRVARRFGIPATGLLDFSANVNPAGPPPAVVSELVRDAANARLLMEYPDDGFFELRAEIAARVAVPATSVLIANGASALIDGAVRAARPRLSLLPVPAFSEYRRALSAMESQVLPFPLREADGFRLDATAFSAAIARARPDLVIVNNPHNPSGSLLSRGELSQILGAARAAGALVLLDEAFIDYALEESWTSTAARHEGLIVLRSLTKFYGMPALRVGYAVASGELTARVGAQIPGWPVTTLALRAAVTALRDRDYAARAIEVNARARSWLAAALGGAGFSLFPSAANFLLLKIPEGAPPARVVRERLIREKGILVRDCSSFEGLASGRFLRVAVRLPAENERLVRALEEVVRWQCRAKKTEQW